MAHFYFFTDIDLLNEQQQLEAFGPLAPELGQDRYQLCSLHNTSGSTPNAYAVCDGIVFIQQDTTEPTLVNLILKPLKTTDTHIGVVKFYIYKGIKKETLIEGDFVAFNTNDLTIRIKQNQDILNTNEDKRLENPTGTTNTRPSNRILGYDIDAPDTDSIEDIFFREDEHIQFPTVQAGWTLGIFNQTRFGFEIVFERIGHDPTLQIARNLEHIVQIDALSPTASQVDTFRHWNAKEEVINYCDPAAFYGSFYTDTLFYKKFGQREKLKGSAIYDLVLKKYYNKNLVYLDIRNRMNHSLNFFLNYNQQIQIGYSEDQSLEEQNYYDTDWPILRIENSSFPTGNTYPKNILRIAFPVGDNTLPKVYLKTGFYNTGNPTGKFPKRSKGRSKFKALAIPDQSLFTSEIALAIPNETTAGNTTIVCSYIHIKYVKGFDATAYPLFSTNTVVNSANLLDNLLRPVDLKIPVKERAEQIRSKVYYSEVYIEDDRELGFDFIAANTIAVDNKNVIFSIYPTDSGFYYHDIENKTSIVGVNLVGTTNDYLSQLALGHSRKTRLTKSQIETEEENIPVLEYQNTTDDRYQHFRSAHLDDLCSIVISKQEYQTIVDLAKSETLDFVQSLPIHLGLRHIETNTDKNNNKYKIYELSLLGYTVTSDHISLNDQLTGIRVYIRTSPPRKRTYASKAASQNINRVASERVVRQKGLVLRSWLLRGVDILQEVAEGGEPIGYVSEVGQRFVHRGAYVGKLQAALRVLIPYYDATYFQSIKSLKIDNVFGPTTAWYVSRYQTLVNLTVSGVVGSNTLSKIDKDLFDIHFFNADPTRGDVKVLHVRSKSVSVGSFTVVSNGDGANFRREPDTSAEIIRNLPYNTRVRIISIAAVKLANGSYDYSWCYVQVDPELEQVGYQWLPKAGQEDKVFGYVAYNLLWTRSEIPDPNAQLYLIKSGDTLLDIVTNTYGVSPTDRPNVAYYIHVLLFANNPQEKVTKTLYSLDKSTGYYSDVKEGVDTAIYVDGGIIWSDVLKNFLIDVPVEMFESVIPLTPPLTEEQNFIPLTNRTWEKLLGAMSRNSWEALDNIKIRSNFTIWLPSKSFAESLRNVIDIGLIENLISKCKDIYDDGLGNFIDKNWPVGTGFTLEWGYGITVPIYGIPIALDKDHSFYLCRNDDKKFTLTVQGEVALGVDTGTGYGAMFGVGSKYKYKYAKNDSRNIGLGGAMGFQLKAGLKLSIRQSYEFDITEDYALANMLSAATLQLGTDVTGIQPFAMGFLNLFKPMNIDPLDYLKSVSVSGGVFVDFQAGGFVGLKLATQNAKDFFSTNPVNENRNGFNKSSGILVDTILRLCTASVNLNLNAELITGFEVTIPEKIFDPETCLRILKPGGTVTTNLFLESSNVISLAADLPVVPVPTINLELTLGIKINFEYIHNESDFNTAAFGPSVPEKGFNFTGYSIYYKAGELDAYNGPGFELLLGIKPLETFSLPNNFDEFKDLITKVSIQKRVGGEKIFNRKYKELLNLHDDLIAHLKYEYRKTSKKSLQQIDKDIRTGFSIGSYATMKFEVALEDFVTLVQTIYEDIVTNRGKASGEALLYLMEYLILDAPPEMPHDTPGIIYSILDAFKLLEFEIHVETGAGIAGEVSGAFIEKARLRGNAAFNVILYHKSLNAILEDIRSLYERTSRTFDLDAYQAAIKARLITIHDDLSELYAEIK